jgi:ubiquinone/menaquinone biosynthesis C-methylase UbiE
MVRLAAKRFGSFMRNSKLELHTGDVEALPFSDAAFTKLCSVNTIYFWRDPAKALAECHRVLKCGGRLLLCFNSREDLERWPTHKHGFRLYELTEVESLLRAAGLSPIEVTSANDAEQGLFYCVTGIVA